MLTCNASEGGIAYADAFERSSTFHAAASFFVLRRDPFTGGFLNAGAHHREAILMCALSFLRESFLHLITEQ